MNSTGGALHFDSDINDTRFFASIAKQEKRVDQFVKNIIKSTDKIDQAFARIGENLENGKFGRGVDSATNRVRTFQDDIIRGNQRTGDSFDTLGSRIGSGGFLGNLRRSQSSISELGRTAVNSNAGAGRSFQKLEADAQKSGDGINNIVGRLTTLIGGFLAIQSAEGFVTKLIEIRSEFENLDVAFTTILNSKERADKLMNEVIAFAATTPFNLTDVAKSTKQLLAYGVAAEDIQDELSTLGNIAAGVSQPIGEIAYLYGTLKTQGRAYAMDIRQFTGRGIPIIEELASVLGVAKNEVMGLVEEGKVGFPEVQKAFQNMTGAGGSFFDLMQKQSLTTGGRISNLKDQIDLMFNSFGAANSDIINGGITAIQYLVANYETVIGLLGTMIATYGAYRAALILTSIIEANMWGTKMLHNGANMVAVTYRLTAAQTLQAIGAGIAAKAQAALNLVMSVNPYVAVATAVVALGAAMYFLSDTTTAQEKAQKALNDQYQEYKKNVEETKAKVRDLNNVLSDKSSTELQQTKAYKELQALYPDILGKMTLENYLKLEAVEIQKKINAENDKNQLKNLNQRYESTTKKVADLTKTLADLERYAGRGSQGGGSTAIDNMRKELEAAKIMAEGLGNSIKKETEELKYSNLSNKEKLEYLKKQEAELVKQKTKFEEIAKISGDLNNVFASYNLGNLNFQLDEVKNKIQGLTMVATAKAPARTVRVIDKEIKDVKDLQEGSSSNKEFKAFEAQIKKLEDEKTKITGKLTKADTKASDERKRFLDNLVESERKSVTKSLSESARAIKEISDKYDEQRKKARELGLGAGVIKRIDAMEKRETGVVNYNIETEKLLKEIDRQKDIYKNYEDFKTTVSATEADKRFKGEIGKYNSFAEYLKSQIKPLMDIASDKRTGPEQDRLTKLLELQKANDLDQTSQRNKQFADALVASRSYEENVNAIKVKYAEMAKALGKEATNKRRESLLYERDLAIEAAKDEAIRKTAIYKKLSQDVILYTEKETKEQIKLLNDLIESGAIPTELLPKIQSQLSDFQFSLKIGIDQANLERLKDETADLLTELNTKDTEGNTIISEAEAKRILKRLAEIKAKMKEIDTTGNGAVSYGDKLSKNFDYLSGDAARVAKGIESDMGRISGAFNELSGALGGVDTQAGYVLDTFGQMAGVVSNAAGAFAAFASGDIIGGVTKAISAVAGLFSIGKKVKEMNAKARKEVADFYATAAQGEINYQALLRERERQLIQINAIGTKGIQDQTSALKKQRNEIALAYADTLRRLQAEEEILSVEYKHGTWFRKAQTNYTYGSLMGVTDYADFEKLYTSGKLTDGAKALFEQLKKLKDEGFDVEEALKSAAKAAAELATGTTADNLSQNIIEKLKAGKTGLQDVMDDYTTIIRDALLSTFKSDVVDVEMKAFYERLAALAESNGELTQDEIDAAKLDYQAVVAKIKKAFEDREKITGQSLTDPTAGANGITANIKSLSQDTGIALEGLIRGIYDLMKKNSATNPQNSINLAKQMQLLNDQVLLQTQIRDNTAMIAQHTNDNLSKLDVLGKALDAIVVNTKPAKTARDLAI